MDGQLVEERIRLAGRGLAILRPPDPEALISEEAFEREEFLPYWAELWPSGLALAEEVAALPLAGRRVLELGCGLGLPSLAAALAGADVLATDWSPDAVALLRENAARNEIELAIEVASWFEPSALAAARRGTWCSPRTSSTSAATSSRCSRCCRGSSSEILVAGPVARARASSSSARTRRGASRHASCARARRCGSSGLTR